MSREYNQIETLEHQLIENENDIAEIDDEIAECEESGENYDESIEVKRQKRINNLKVKKRALKRNYAIVDNLINKYYDMCEESV